jgi:serine/threonine protein kinase
LSTPSSAFALTDDDTAKISDFGLVRTIDGAAGVTWIGAAMGTPSYMAPEQAEAKALALEGSGHAMS